MQWVIVCLLSGLDIQFTHCTTLLSIPIPIPILLPHYQRPVLLSPDHIQTIDSLHSINKQLHLLNPLLLLKALSFHLLTPYTLEISLLFTACQTKFTQHTLSLLLFTADYPAHAKFNVMPLHADTPLSESLHFDSTP